MRSYCLCIGCWILCSPVWRFYVVTKHVTPSCKEPISVKLVKCIGISKVRKISLTCNRLALTCAKKTEAEWPYLRLNLEPPPERLLSCELHGCDIETDIIANRHAQEKPHHFLQHQKMKRRDCMGKFWRKIRDSQNSAMTSPCKEVWNRQTERMKIAMFAKGNSRVSEKDGWTWRLWTISASSDLKMQQMTLVKGSANDIRFLSKVLSKDWKYFLRHSDNKTELFSYLVQFVHENLRPEGKTEMVTIGENALCWPVRDTSLINPCNHKEADTRIFVHLQDAQQGQGMNRAIIYTIDTDNVVLGSLLQ
eukprot:gene7388-13137_t